MAPSFATRQAVLFEGNGIRLSPMAFGWKSSGASMSLPESRIVLVPNRSLHVRHLQRTGEGAQRPVSVRRPPQALAGADR